MASNLPMRLLRRKLHKRNLKLRQCNLAQQGEAGQAGTWWRREMVLCREVTMSLLTSGKGEPIPSHPVVLQH